MSWASYGELEGVDEVGCVLESDWERTSVPIMPLVSAVVVFSMMKRSFEFLNPFMDVEASMFAVFPCSNPVFGCD